MLTDHDARREHDLPFEFERPREQAQMTFPVLEEPTWLEDDEPEEMEAPRDSAFRGVWIGIAAAAVTFVLVFAIPHWLGWYDVGPPTQPAKREESPESVISTVTAKASGSAAATKSSGPAVEDGAPSTPPTAAPPASPPPAAPAKSAAPPAAARPAPVQKDIQKETKPAPPTKRTYTVQVAAFKHPKQAGRFAARVKGGGYPAKVQHIESAAVPWVVRVGTYATREQAESARDALARKGFRGFIL